MGGEHVPREDPRRRAPQPSAPAPRPRYPRPAFPNEPRPNEPRALQSRESPSYTRSNTSADPIPPAAQAEMSPNCAPLRAS